LILVGLTYLFAGVSKVFRGPLREWATGEQLARTIRVAELKQYHSSAIGEFIIQSPLLADLGAIFTILLEIGLLPATLLGVSITPVILGLLVFHTVIAIAMGPFFLDQYIIFLLFLPWDTVHRRYGTGRPVSVTYDAHNRRLVGALLCWKILDLDGELSFNDASGNHDGGASSMDGTLRVTANGTSYNGYAGIRRLLAYFVVLRPFAYFAGLPGVRRVGRHIYERYFNSGHTPNELATGSD
jgi:hypothetical protein